MRAWWQHKPAADVAVLYARCENCRWSGPLERFDIWMRRRSTVYICCADECQTTLVIRALWTSGYIRADQSGPVRSTEHPRP